MLSSYAGIVDLFSGCGGFGLGAEMAGLKVELAIDVDPILQSAYRLNFPETRCITTDLSKTGVDFWEKHLQGHSPIGVIGGPPCQAFSTMGRRCLSDSRRALLYHFFRHVSLLKPKFFIMENVPGLASEQGRMLLDEAKKILDNQYEISGPIFLDASDFGAPTKRNRVFVVGFDKDKAVNDFESKIELFKTKHKATVSDAISDLPSPIESEFCSHNFDWMKPRSEFCFYKKQIKTLPPKGLGWKVALNKHETGMTSGFISTRHSEKVLHRFRKLTQGQVDKIGKHKRLSWDGFCPTLRAGTGSDFGSHQAVRPLHPEENRVISIREAARLQGFPDWFVFHPTKWHSFRMIGNSVSPILAESIMRTFSPKEFTIWPS